MDSSKQNDIQFDEGTPDDPDTGSSFLKNIIIVPQHSSWYSLWKFIFHILLFIGYIIDPLYIAIMIGSTDQYF